MGQVATRINGALGRGEREPAQEGEDDPERQLSFPSTAGSYFGSHFLMCGGRFDLAKPEAYLFGENSDLDLLGSRAVPFPYASPLGSNEVHPLNLLINIRKESVKFSRVRKETVSDVVDYDPNLYRLEFTLDAECPCFVQIHYNAREFYHDNAVQFAYRNKKVNHSEIFHFDLGCDQSFNNYVFDLSKWDIDELHYGGGHYFPFVIMVQTEGVESPQTQTTLCTIDQANDSSHMLILKPLRQKIACDGVVYLLQEIFGIENKEQGSEAGDEGGLECIICMSDVRDTVILPCRHVCICNNCADTLRYKLNNCPICRSPFRALIHLRARRQTRNQGFETVTLVEGLNGPLNPQYNEADRIVHGENSPLKQRAMLPKVQDPEDDDDSDSKDSCCVELDNGIEMKRYVPKTVRDRGGSGSGSNETPVMSNVSSRSVTPISVEKVHVSVEELRNVRRNNSDEDASSHSSSELLDEEEREREREHEGHHEFVVGLDNPSLQSDE